MNPATTSKQQSGLVTGRSILAEVVNSASALQPASFGFQVAYTQSGQTFRINCTKNAVKHHFFIR